MKKYTTGGPLIVPKNGSIFFGKPYYENTNKIAVLWEELEILLNKHKPYYREIRTMRGRTMRGPPVVHSALVIFSHIQFLVRLVSVIFKNSFLHLLSVDWLFTDPTLVSTTRVNDSDFFLYPINKIFNVENITYMAYLMTTIQWNRCRYLVFTVG